MEPMFSQIEIFPIQFYLMHTKTKMYILFKNEINIANYLEEKKPRPESEESDDFAGVGTVRLF